MGNRFTRRQFLAATGAGVACLALTGCDPREGGSKGGSPEGGGGSGASKVWPARDVPSGPDGRAWSFRSRPDLRPPAVTVRTRANGRAPGHVFISPKLGKGQHGPLIVDDMGRPVWFRNGLYALNFRVQEYRGEPVLTWWEGEPTPRPSVGVNVMLDGSYREVKRVQAGNGFKANQHDFLLSPQGTALITVYDLVDQDLSYLGGPVGGKVIEGIVQEVDVETGEVLFEWHSLDHVDVEESYIDNYYSPQLDYFHINSIDVDHDDNLLISARNTSAIYKIDRKSGEVMWRLGGKKSDFEMGKGTRTFWQHDARRHEDGTISIFDNGAHPRVHLQSRGIVVDLDEDSMEATMVREYTRPDGLVSTSQGNMQVLPNGNVVVGWGSEPAVSEFSRDGELLFDASFPTGCESYRAFRLPWKGRPTDTPALAVGRSSHDRVTLHASWNGATEVESWEVLSGPHPDRLEPLGAVPRDGFETVMLAQTRDPYLAVRATDDSGQILGTSVPRARSG